jgi:hypothetical protein
MPIPGQPIDTTPYPIDENGNNVYPQPGDPDYRGPTPQPPGIMPIQPIGPIPPGDAYPNPFPITPGPGRPQPPGIMPVPPREYPTRPGRGPGWGARPWAPPRRSPFGGRYPMNPGIRLGGGVLEQGQAPADPLQALLMKLQGGG